MNIGKKTFSLIIAVLLLCATCWAGSAFAENETSVVHIRSREDFVRLAEQCSLDTWSKGITVELETDLDFGGEDIHPIPSFSGTFNGNGHSITGLTLSTDGSNQALFRYVTADAVVRDLTVEGSIAPTYGRLRIAGIVGTNWGQVSNCTFTGSVSGLNYVGGIVGENHGVIDSCTFTGTVDGKRFSGGIAGYNEGVLSNCVSHGNVNITVNVESMNLEDLATATTGLALNLLNAEDENVISDTGGIVGFSKGVVLNCNNSGTIGYPHFGYNVGGIAGRQSGYLSGCRNSGPVYGRKDVAGIVGQMEPYLDLVRSTSLADELLLLNKYMNNASGDISAMAAEFRDLQDAINEEQAISDGISINEGTIYHADEYIPQENTSGGSIISGSGGTISGGDTGGIIDGISDGSISPGDVSIDVDSISERIDTRMNELAGRLGEVYGVIQASGGDLAYDLSQANDQFSRVMLLMANAMNGSPQTDLFSDVSEQSGEAATEGLVSKNTNYGSVDGDNNIGGIVGAMGIEYEFDLEDSLAQIVGANGIINNTYNSNCVSASNVNFGSVQAKKDRAGGTVGSEETGTVMNCESYGSVTSTDGSYVGGIAGYSDTSIHNSYAFCLVNGTRYVGGIAGSANSIVDSVSMIETDASGAFIGAVAGWADMTVEDSVKGNLYVHDSLGAVDGISYVGRATPISYDELIAQGNVPDGFRQVSLSFFVDGTLIRTLRVDYGGSLAADSIPAVPVREGYTGSWSEFETENIRFSRDIEAVYTQNHSSIAADQTRDDSPLSIVLLEGSFTDNDVLTLIPYAGEAPSIPESQTVETWDLSLTATGQTDTDYTVRYLPPTELQGKEITIYRLKDGEWEPVEAESSGSYLTFPADDDHVVFSAVTPEAKNTFLSQLSGINPAIIAGVGGLLVLLIVVLIVHGHRKKKRKSASSDDPSGSV